jgi:hypothetical protein
LSSFVLPRARQLPDTVALVDGSSGQLLTFGPFTFPEFPDGERLVSGRRTITEADVVAFAGLSGDFNGGAPRLRTGRSTSRQPPGPRRSRPGLTVGYQPGGSP